MTLTLLPTRRRQTLTVELPFPDAVWNASTIDALLSALKHKTCITIGWPERNTWVHSMILGFDIDNGDILMSEFWPAMPVQCLPEGKMYLQIPYQEGWMIMEAVVQSTLTAQGNTMIVQAQNGSFTQNRRWYGRVEFSMREGPVARVRPKGCEQREAYIANISRGGCLLHCLAKDLRSHVKQGAHIDVTITFNEYFSVTTQAKVLSIHFARSPCCHTQLRLSFPNLGQEEYYQLDSYIDYHAYRFSPSGHELETLH